MRSRSAGACPRARAPGPRCRPGGAAAGSCFVVLNEASRMAGVGSRWKWLSARLRLKRIGTDPVGRAQVKSAVAALKFQVRHTRCASAPPRPAHPQLALQPDHAQPSLLDVRDRQA